jgi:hypothetical protein
VGEFRVPTPLPESDTIPQRGQPPFVFVVRGPRMGDEFTEDDPLPPSPPYQDEIAAVKVKQKKKHNGLVGLEGFEPSTCGL